MQIIGNNQVVRGVGIGIAQNITMSFLVCLVTVHLKCKS
jgi:hypothetical protein